MTQKTIISSLALAWLTSLSVSYLLGGYSVQTSDTTKEATVQQRALNSTQTSLNSSNTQAKNSFGSKSPRTPGKGKPKMRSILRNPNRLERLAAITELAATMDSAQFATMFEELREEMRVGTHSPDLGLLLYAWSKKDGSAALRYLESADTGMQGGWYYNSSALRGWGESDPDAAIAWAEGKENSDRFSGALSKVANGVVKVDIWRAADLAQEMKNASARGRILNKVVYELLEQQDANAAMNWVDSLKSGDENFRRDVANRVAGQMARNDPKGASEWVLGLDIDQKKSAVKAVASEWGRKAPEDAANWALEVEDTDLRPQWLSSVINVWADQDVNAAGTWLGQIPPSPEFDQSARSFALKVEDFNPAEAIAWASSIGDESLRNTTVTKIAEKWLKENPSEANAFLQEQEN